MTYVPPETPYCGFMRRFVKGREQLFVPRTAAHCLISAPPTESGKSRRLLAPASALWGGPVVQVSSKDDVMQLTMERRFGPKAVIDFRPIIDRSTRSESSRWCTTRPPPLKPRTRR